MFINVEAVVGSKIARILALLSTGQVLHLTRLQENVPAGRTSIIGVIDPKQVTIIFNS